MGGRAAAGAPGGEYVVAGTGHEAPGTGEAAEPYIQRQHSQPLEAANSKHGNMRVSNFLTIVPPSLQQQASKQSIMATLHDSLLQAGVFDAQKPFLCRAGLRQWRWGKVCGQGWRVVAARLLASREL